MTLYQRLCYGHHHTLWECVTTLCAHLGHGHWGIF